MVNFEDAIVRVWAMAQVQQGLNPRPFDQTGMAQFDYQQGCLAVVEDFIVNQCPEDN